MCTKGMMIPNARRVKEIIEILITTIINPALDTKFLEGKAIL